MSESHNLGIVGRFAPSPTGRLHLGNLRTAIAAYEQSTSNGGKFLIRMEDLDLANASRTWAMTQLLDLAAVGAVSGEQAIFQSDRFSIYREFVKQLTDENLTYECFCTRKEIAEATRAPHGRVGRYPGLCRELSETGRMSLRAQRRSAIRLKAPRDAVGGEHIDDIVLVRNDGVPAYNLAVVVDDELQGVTQVVRGEDLLHVTASQCYLQDCLGFRRLTYLHLPLLCGPDGKRLSKRHGDVTLGDCLRLGFSPPAVRKALLRSLEVGSNGWGPSSSLAEWLESLL